MSDGWPEAVPFDPSDASRAELRATLLGSAPDAPVLVLVAGGGPDDWRRRAAIAIADAVSAPDRRALLLDLHVPTDLGGLLGAADGDGLEDVLSFGASLEHALHRPAGHAFDFLGPGASAADAGLLVAAEGWPALLRRLTARDRQVVLYGPADALRQGAWGEASRSVLLAPETRDVSGDPAPVAWLAPPRRRTAIDAEYERVRIPRAAEREAFIADRRRAARPFGPGQSAPVLTPPPAPGSTEPPADPRRHLAEPMVTRPVRRQGRRAPFAWSIGVALLVSLLAGAWHFIGRDWFQQRRAETVAAPLTPSDTAQSAAPAPIALAYSVAIEAHSDLTTAHERIASLRAADPAVDFFISPVLVDSVLYFRLLAGPVVDSAEAALVMQRLVATGQKTAATQRDIRRAPLSFLVGQFETRAQADAERERLRGLEIPAFVLPSPRAPGAHRLYAGAYSGLAEADVMARLLRAAGLPDSLVTLTGGSP